MDSKLYIFEIKNIMVWEHAYPNISIPNNLDERDEKLLKTKTGI